MQKDTNPRNVSNGQLALTSLAIVILGIADGLAKIFALRLLPEEQVAKLQPVFSLAIHKNPGILFDIPVPLQIIAPLTIIALLALGSLAWNARHDNKPVFLGALAAFVGAANNLIDRLINGFTTDYLIIFKTSAINISDVLILLGIIFVLWYSRQNSRAQQKT